MLPYCHPNKSAASHPPTKSRFLSFYHSLQNPHKKWEFQDKESLYKKKAEIPPSPCFEQYLMHFFLHNSKSITHKFQKEEIPLILKGYPIPNFPENIRVQFFQECENILETFCGMEKDKIIQHLMQYIPLWGECNTNASQIDNLLAWISNEPDKRNWLIKMLKIFILGIHPNIERRKKGDAFVQMVNNHLYQFS